MTGNCSICAKGFAGRIARSGCGVRRPNREDLAHVEPCDLIILDVMLPEKEGFDILKTLRTAGIATPVMMLTARSEVADRVKGWMSVRMIISLNPLQ